MLIGLIDSTTIDVANEPAALFRECDGRDVWCQKVRRAFFHGASVGRQGGAEGLLPAVPPPVLRRAVGRRRWKLRAHRGEEAKHAIKVLRLKALDSIEVCDGRGGVARCTIRSAGATTSSGRRERRGFRVTAEVESRRLEPWTGIRWKLCVAGGSVKGARGDWLVEKATELGAHSFQPLLTDRSARMGSRGGSEGGSGREERWKRLAVSASKQCLRPHFLDIEPAITLDDLLLDRDGLGITLAAHQSGDPLLPLLMEHRPRLLSLAERGCLIVGPEGDFSDRELELLRRQDGVSVVGLGDLRLRVETAALSLLSGARLSEGLAAA